MYHPPKYWLFETTNILSANAACHQNQPMAVASQSATKLQKLLKNLNLILKENRPSFQSDLQIHISVDENTSSIYKA